MVSIGDAIHGGGGRPNTGFRVRRVNDVVREYCYMIYGYERLTAVGYTVCVQGSGTCPTAPREDVGVS